MMRPVGTLVLAVAAIACGPKGGTAEVKEPTEPPAEPTEPPAEPAERPAALGATKETAVEVCFPQGERRYLSAQTCADGSRPRFQRVGSVGSRHEGDGKSDAMGQIDPCRALDPGELDVHIIDLYELECPERSWQVYLDMYHCTADECAAMQ